MTSIILFGSFPEEAWSKVSIGEWVFLLLIKTAVFIVILAVYLWVWKEMSIRVIIFFLIPYSLYASISIAGIMLDKSPSEVVKGVISSLQAPDSRPEPPQPELQQAPPPDPVTTTTTTLPATQDEPSAVPAASVATQTPDPKPEVMESSAGSDTPQRQTWKSPGKVTYQNDRWTYTNDLGMTFAYIPPGEFWMGSPEDEPGRFKDESPRHHVEISTGFFMQTTEVTQGQWKAVMMGYNPSRFKDCGDDCPVEQVSWNDVQEFIERLNAREGEKVYRLPTEAEWEYAARAGTTTPFAFGDCLSTDEANYRGTHPLQGCPKGEYREKTIPVGSLNSPNSWGLHDIHGNVWEWCQDWHGAYPDGPVTDPQGPDTGGFRVFRGGSWVNDAVYCRSAYRSRNTPGGRGNYLGFRLLRSSP